MCLGLRLFMCVLLCSGLRMVWLIVCVLRVWNGCW